MEKEETNNERARGVAMVMMGEGESEGEGIGVLCEAKVLVQMSGFQFYTSPHRD